MDGDLIDQVESTLGETGLPGRSLVLEVTERAVMEDLNGVGLVLRELERLGVGLWLDDFGTGYSSLSALHRLSFDGVKIDRSFIRRLGVRPRSDHFVEGILTLYQGLDIKVIAEGVETLQQRDFLREIHCEDAQGFFFSEPVAGDRAESLLFASD